MTPALARLIAAQICLHACMTGIRLAAPLWALHAGYSGLAVGGLLALFALTQVFLALPAGRLAKGAPADLVLCDLNAPLLIDADKLVSKSKNSPFDGRRLQGKVLRTVVDGRTVFGS